MALTPGLAWTPSSLMSSYSGAWLWSQADVEGMSVWARRTDSSSPDSQVRACITQHPTPPGIAGSLRGTGSLFQSFCRLSKKKVPLDQMTMLVPPIPC